MLSAQETGSTGLMSRIRGKKGRFRQNIMGWRVNHAGRAVITPDPLLAPWEVGVPSSIASEIGIADGDTCIMNRQPSLHRGSMMAHVARIRPYASTLTISPTVTSPYNADFDGDEMNLHVPQSIPAAPHPGEATTWAAFAERFCRTERDRPPSPPMFNQSHTSASRVSSVSWLGRQAVLPRLGGLCLMG